MSRKEKVEEQIRGKKAEDIRKKVDKQIRGEEE